MENKISSETISLIVTNETSEDKVVRLFDCNVLFNPAQDNCVKIENAYDGVSYKEMLIQLLSGETKINIKRIRIQGYFAKLEKDKDYFLMTFFCKNIYSHQFIRNIAFKKCKGQVVDDLIEASTTLIINNGCYIEYIAKANTRVLMAFVNMIDDSLPNVNGVAN